MKETNSSENYEAQTLILNDSNGTELFCYLEQLVSIEGQEYGLYIPLDPFFIVGKLKTKVRYWLKMMSSIRFNL